MKCDLHFSFRADVCDIFPMSFIIVVNVVAGLYRALTFPRRIDEVDEKGTHIIDA
jgi:hypothetical protein